MSLVRAERRRFAKRRMIIWTLIIGLLFLGAVAAGAFAFNQKHSPEAFAVAQAEADRQYEEHLRFHQRDVEDCKERNPGSQECVEMEQWGPQREWYTAEQYLGSTFNFKRDFQPMVITWAYIMTMVSFIIGATFVGAEWRTGAMMNLLTWRPRRWQVLGTKLGVLVGWLTGIGVATLGLWTAAMWGVALLRGTTEGMTSGAWQSAGLTGLRGLGMALAAGAIGFGFASLGRHTAVPLVGGLALGILSAISMPVLLMAQVPFTQRYLLPTYLHAWVDKSVEVENWFWEPGPGVCDGPEGCVTPTITITWQHSALLAGAGLVLIIGLAFWQMRRRDIT